MSIISFLSVLVFVACCIFKVAHGDDFSNEIFQESRKRKQQDILTRIIPALATPFIVQTLLLPIVLFFMKFVLAKSIFLGKLGVFLWIVNTIRSRLREGEGAFSSHNVNLVHKDHYGHRGRDGRVWRHWEKDQGEVRGYKYRKRKRR